jgi:hypothetical protein
VSLVKLDVTPHGPSARQLDLKWDEVQGANYYVIHRSTIPNFFPTKNNIIKMINDPKQTSYIDRGPLAPSKAYYYKVVAHRTAELRPAMANYVRAQMPSINLESLTEEKQSQEASGQTGGGGAFILIIGISSFLVAGLIVALAIYDNSYDPEDYTLTFSGATTYDKNGLSVDIDNTGANLSKVMNIFGINNNNSHLSSSSLTDRSGKILDAQEIEFDGQSSLALKNMANNTWKSIKISTTQADLPRGSYSGQFIISGNSSYTIPVTLESEPKIVQAIMLVAMGVLIAIVVWEIIRYIKLPLDEAQSELGTNEAQDFAELAQKEKENDPRSPEAARLEVMAQVKQKVAADKTSQVERHYIREASPGHTMGRIALIELLSGAVGIAAAMIALLNSDYFNGLRIIGPLDITVLIGLGLGIGSLKEFSSDK